MTGHKIIFSVKTRWQAIPAEYDNSRMLDACSDAGRFPAGNECVEYAWPYGYQASEPGSKWQAPATTGTCRYSGDLNRNGVARVLDTVFAVEINQGWLVNRRFLL